MPTRFFGMMIFLGFALAATAEPPPSLELVQGARAQIGVTVLYDPAYRKLDYPGGDIPLDRGVCTDVVVRALRAVDHDLQQLVHRDMRRAFKSYPQNWGLKRPDKNIDHRRVPNLRAYFRRQGKSLPVSDDPADYNAGDFVTWLVNGNLPHIGIVSTKRVDGRPWIIHNIGAGAREEDILWEYPITGHYRYFPPTPKEKP